MPAQLSFCPIYCYSQGLSGKPKRQSVRAWRQIRCREYLQRCGQGKDPVRDQQQKAEGSHLLGLEVRGGKCP